MSREETLKEEILSLVRDYYEEVHKPKAPVIGKDKLLYGGRVFDQEEMLSLVDSSLEFWLTGGRFVKEFEEKLGAFVKCRHCYFVNSGSSANLLAFMSLTSPLLGERQILPQDEVITVACGFPTTITPILQYGAVPVFVDVTIPQYNIDVSRLEEARSEKTKAVMIAHTLGNPFDLTAVKAFCDKYQLWLVEDNCDALGSTYFYENQWRPTGSMGDVGTSSFYPPHHLTTGEGGAVYTNHPILGKILLSMRDWGRDCVCSSGQDNLCSHRFEGQYGELPYGYDHKYVYSHFGYNLKATDLQASIGVAQLDKLDGFTQKRQENFQTLLKRLQPLEEYFILPAPCPNSNPSWFGFLLTCREGVSREEIVSYLEEKGVQTRMLFAGNMLKQPCFDQLRKENRGYRVVGDLSQTNRIMEHSFWLGVYPGINGEILEYMAKTLEEACLKACSSDKNRLS